ncbi:hypothetical protein SAMN03080615_03368 [Amphritea atlantica]|uniref:Sulfotransferase domain-containing protein n=1 Tax=Amphritea atlantica TaxID=355243 RepID=A0A1H9K821_9GAMM|nr:hypothetical protein [Amphritea atlantica]SEQ95269.1 hypothetical protein SAMN03080615_03368 [Amphritea atlantica]
MIRKIFDKYKEGRTFSKPRLRGSNLCYSDYDIVIHIGAPKTGSSALQAFFLNNRDALLSCGYYYPEHGVDDNNVSGGHSVVGVNLIKKDFISASRFVDEWVVQAKERNKTLLISAESLYSKPRMLKSILENYRVGIVAYFRDPIELLISNYNQAVKRHFATIDLKGFAKNVLVNESDGYSGLIFSLWAECFGKDNVCLLPYGEGFFPEGKIEFSFLDLLGVSKLQRKSFKYHSKRINVSYTSGALEYKRLVNCLFDKDESDFFRRVDNCLQKYSDLNNKGAEKPILLLGEDVFFALIEKFKLSNKYLIDNFFGGVAGDFLSYNDQYDIGEELYIKNSCLSDVVQTAFNDCSELVVKVRDRVGKRLAEGPANYAILKLADLLDVEFNEGNYRGHFFNEGQMKVLLSDKSKEADLLREIAVSLERDAKYNDAYQVICRAADVRKDGVGIFKIKDRLEKILENKQ